MPSALLYTNNTVLNNTTNAQFRQWGSVIANAFNTAGWVRSTHGTEIDWTTVAANASTLTSWGFEIWRMNDSLQSTSPVYLRIDYGSGAQAYTPRIWVQVGSGILGNVLTGSLSAQTFSSATANSGSTEYPCYFSGANNRMLFAMGATSSNGFLLSLERTHDANGGDTDEGVLIMSSNVSWASGWQQYWNCKTGPTAIETNLGAFTPQAGTGSTGDSVSIYPVYLSRGSFTNPSLNLLTALSGGVTNLSSLNVTFFGSTHTYLPLGSVTLPNRSGSSTVVLMRWE
jgi:hypothetical protein